MKAFVAGCAMLAAVASLSGGVLAQGAPDWLAEFRERPADEGGDIRYLTLDLAANGALQMGCVRNRIEKVLIYFPAFGGSTAPLPPNPQVEYSFDNEPMQAANWPLFESGAIVVPRGSEANKVVRRMTTAVQFNVRATGSDGAWYNADFTVANGQQLLKDMLQACNIN